MTDPARAVAPGSSPGQALRGSLRERLRVTEMSQCSMPSGSPAAAKAKLAERRLRENEQTFPRHAPVLPFVEQLPLVGQDREIVRARAAEALDVGSKRRQHALLRRVRRHHGALERLLLRVQMNCRLGAIPMG